ncbi:hypothetical protein E6Q11_06500 [Candidatus Dojkabacteria bacterium]|uniref:Uncharacterized protein n=1 Tax=Candidatus Dojkabacteria bacterium TaxID=2099670 RepID=A0A5C7J2W8_9BACT|nr:MAG: hypothetical protein E6Q11_06500 [Candidatus Dojkabacteria bacterium]
MDIVTLASDGLDIMTKKYIAYGVIAVIGLITLIVFGALLSSIFGQIKYSKATLPELETDKVVEVNETGSAFFIPQEDKTGKKKKGANKKESTKPEKKKSGRRKKSKVVSKDGNKKIQNEITTASGASVNDPSIEQPLVDKTTSFSLPELETYSVAETSRHEDIALPTIESLPVINGDQNLVELDDDDDAPYLGNRRARDVLD